MGTIACDRLPSLSGRQPSRSPQLFVRSAVVCSPAVVGCDVHLRVRHAVADSARDSISGATFDAPIALCAHLGYLWTLRWLPPVHLSIAVSRSLVFGPL